MSNAKLEIREHASSGYRERTGHNARSAGVTVALAVDFMTAGEKLTRSLAGDRYVGIPLETAPVQAARMLFKKLVERDAYTLNVAGNGLHTLGKHGWSQNRANAHLHAILSLVHQHRPLGEVISGGQTGIDIAGITAAHALGIPAIATLPKGFRIRLKNGTDVNSSEAAIRDQVTAWAERLRKKAVEPICPYCGNRSHAATGRTLYPGRPDLADKRFFACQPCQAWCGCHPDGAPLGQLANAGLRALRMEAHALFDPMWKSGKKKRDDVYAWLAAEMGIPFKDCHIGHFDEDACRKAIAILSKVDVF